MCPSFRASERDADYIEIDKSALMICTYVTRPTLHARCQLMYSVLKFSALSKAVITHHKNVINAKNVSCGNFFFFSNMWCKKKKKRQRLFFVCLFVSK